MLTEFLDESRRIIHEFDKCYLRHASRIEAETDCPTATKKEQWYDAIEALLQFGEPEDFSYDFHELRRQILAAKDAGADLEIFDTFIRIGSICGGAPLWSAIWDANQWLDIFYRPPSSAREEPQFEVWAYEAAVPAVSALKLYVKVAESFGEDNLMAILDGAPMIVEQGPQKV